MLSSHRSTERKLAAYLLSEPEKSAVMSAEELAEASGVSYGVGVAYAAFRRDAVLRGAAA